MPFGLKYAIIHFNYIKLWFTLDAINTCPYEISSGQNFGYKLMKSLLFPLKDTFSHDKLKVCFTNHIKQCTYY